MGTVSGREYKLAAVTRYAVGLLYIPEKGFDDERELNKLKRDRFSGRIGCD